MTNRDLNTNTFIFNMKPEFVIPVILDATGPNLIPSGQDRRRNRRANERANHKK